MSSKYKINKADLKKIGTAFMFSMASAIVAFAIALMQEVDFGQLAPMIPIINVMLYSATKWLEGR